MINFELSITQYTRTTLEINCINLTDYYPKNRKISHQNNFIKNIFYRLKDFRSIL